MTNKQKNIITLLALITLPLWLFPLLLWMLITSILDSIKSGLFDEPYDYSSLHCRNFLEAVENSAQKEDKRV